MWYDPGAGAERNKSGGIREALLSDDPQEFRTDSINRISADGCALGLSARH